MSSVSVIICTRDRSESVVPMLRSVLANDHSDFEVILVDQNDGPETEMSIQQFLADARFHYLRSSTRGKGAGLNVGLAQARGEVVLLTDDDCRVPVNWIEKMCDAFRIHERIGVVFCNVEAGPHDAAAGHVPSYSIKRDRVVRNMLDKCNARGMGAGMGVRRVVLEGVEGFDEFMGPGARFPSSDDGDLAVRALLRGFWVYETADVGVIHDGFRTWEQGQGLANRNGVAIGAMLAKPLKCGHWQVVLPLLYEALVIGLVHPLSNLLRLRRPRGLRAFLYLWVGFVRGLLTPVDARSIRYKSAELAAMAQSTRQT